jgi:hypothetical protein
MDPASNGVLALNFTKQSNFIHEIIKNNIH